MFTFYKQIRSVRNEMIKKLRGKWVNFDFVPLEENPINLQEFHVFVTYKYDFNPWFLMLFSVTLEHILYDWSLAFARPVVACIID